MAEFENPTRRYKWFRPRQAARGYGFVAATNAPFVTLFNDSTGPYLLVIRSLRVVSFNGTVSASDFAQQGTVGSPFGASVIPLVPSMGTPNGVIYVDDNASTPDVNSYNWVGPQGTDQWWQQDFPLAIVEPGWSYGLVGSTGKNLQVSFAWETVFPDELDFFF